MRQISFILYLACFVAIITHEKLKILVAVRSLGFFTFICNQLQDLSFLFSSTTSPFFHPHQFYTFLYILTVIGVNFLHLTLRTRSLDNILSLLTHSVWCLIYEMQYPSPSRVTCNNFFSYLSLADDMTKKLQTIIDDKKKGEEFRKKRIGE